MKVKVVYYSSLFMLLLSIDIFLDGCGQKKMTAESKKNDSSITKTNTKLNVEDSLIGRRDSLLNEFAGKLSFNYVEKVNIGTSIMEIETFCLNDTLDSKYSVNDVVSRPIIEKQRITFKNEKGNIKSIFLRVKTIDVKNSRGNTLKVPEITVWRIFSVSGNKGALFVINGTGMCNGDQCPELTGLYSIEGKTVYQKESKDFDKEEFLKKLDLYGITEQHYKDSQQKGHRVDRFW